MASASTNFKTGDAFRRQKELEEARKAGLAPAELDEEGNEINPHIPQYMSNAPWYLNSTHPSLKHHKNWKKDDPEADKQWYDRGAKVFQASKFRKGACENCGSMSHVTKDCLERPRAKGARWTNMHIAADDKVSNINLKSFDAKRDRWNGYDAGDYSKVMDRYERLEEIRKDMKHQEAVQQITSGKAAEPVVDDHKEDEGDDDDDAKFGDEEDAGFGEVKKRVRTTAGGATGSVRNLRIREDIAKYLLNLDPNSAHYDPKSRSMRADPNPDKPDTEKTFMGDNAVRKSGDYDVWQSLTVHSLQAYDKGTDVHMQANPSLAELMHKQFKQKKDTLQKVTKSEVLDKYGNAAKAPTDDALLLCQSEAYIEYDVHGRVVKGSETKARSKYEEDVYVNNHTSVWGSWWRDGTWGYACCHQCIKNSYCTGKVGEAAAEDANELMLANMEARAAEKAAEDLKKREASKLKGYVYSKDATWGSDVDPALQLDKEKVREAMRRQAEGEREDGGEGGDERKRKFNSIAGGDEDVSAEDMEAYRMRKVHVEDPMAKLVGKSADGYDYL